MLEQRMEFQKGEILLRLYNPVQADKFASQVWADFCKSASSKADSPQRFVYDDCAVLLQGCQGTQQQNKTNQLGKVSWSFSTCG